MTAIQTVMVKMGTACFIVPMLRRGNARQGRSSVLLLMFYIKKLKAFPFPILFIVKFVHEGEHFFHVIVQIKQDIPVSVKIEELFEQQGEFARETDAVGFCDAHDLKQELVGFG